MAAQHSGPAHLPHGAAGAPPGTRWGSRCPRRWTPQRLVATLGLSGLSKGSYTAACNASRERSARICGPLTVIFYRAGRSRR